MANQVFLAFSALWLCSITPGTSTDSSSILWCPESYRAFEKKGFLFHICLPKSCAKKMPDALTLLDNEDSSRSHCQPFTTTFERCQKARLFSDQYNEGYNSTIFNKLDKSYVQHGEYFFQSNEVTVCVHGVPTSPEAQTMALQVATTPKPCMPFEVSKDDYKWQSNDTLYVSSIGVNVTKGYYQQNGNGSVIRVCYQNDFKILGCKPLIRIGSDEMTILPTMSLNTTFKKIIVYPLGDYALVENKEFALVCVRNSGPLYHGALTVNIYGVASLISAVCILLALLAHLFFPHINYHTKALLCLAFSLLIMYIAICIRNFGIKIDFTRVGNMIIFAIQYIFALSSFLWLNVVAFDLWRVFSEQRAHRPHAIRKANQKRYFILYCVYAFGIPVLLCAAAIGISFSETIQDTLKIYMVFNNNNWFQGDVGALALFYGPVMAILVSNAIFFGLTVKNIRKVRKGSDVLRSNNKDIKIFKVYMKLFLIMGLSWFAEIVYFFAKDETDETVWYVTDLINILQGVFIFLVYVCKKKTLQKIKEKFKHTSTTTNRVSQQSRSTRISSQREESQGISTISLTPISVKWQV